MTPISTDPAQKRITISIGNSPSGSRTFRDKAGMMVALFEAARPNASRLWKGGLMRRVFAISVVMAIAAMIRPAHAETICVKKGPCPLNISAFECTDVPKTRLIGRVCYDPLNWFLVVKLWENWTPYCSVAPGVVRVLLTADSPYQFYKKEISTPRGARGPYDCREYPMPDYSDR